MDRCKYIILKYLHIPILFPASRNHSDIAEKFGGLDSVTSAGFVQFDYNPDTGEVEAYCYGKSTSLGLGPRENDSWLITQMTKRY